MSNKIRGGINGKYLLCLLLILLLVGFFIWKQNYGVIGHVTGITGSTAGELVFVKQSQDGKTELFMVRGDGSGLQMITADGLSKRMPAWSPDGRQICYAGESKGENSRTFQLFLLGSGSPQQLTSGSTGKDSPLWSSNGKQIAFLSGGAIKVINPNGAALSQIYPPPHKGGNQSDEDQTPEALHLPPIGSLKWAPGAATIAAIQILEGENAPAMGQSDWWNKTPDTTSSGQEFILPEGILLLPGLDVKPLMIPMAMATRASFDWMPDSTRIVAALSGQGQVHRIAIFRMDDVKLPSQDVFLAKQYTVAAENPTVSPDGTRVAFELWRMSSSEDRELLGISQLPLDSLAPVIIRSASDIPKLQMLIKGHASEPHFSPDGKKLLYTIAGPKGRDICVSNADGSNVINLTKGQGDCFNAVWSPALK